MRIPTRIGRGERPILLLLPLIVVAAIVAACGNAASRPGVGGGGSLGAQVPGGAEQPASSAAPAEPNGANGGTGNGSNAGKGTNAVPPAAVKDTALIIRTGSIQVQVTDVASAMAKARDAVTTNGGYVGGSRQQRDDDQIVATVTYRVPVDRWEATLDAVRGLGKVMGESTDSAEVTAQVVDLDARIRNLKASETALVGYAAQAPKVTDLLEIEDRLTSTRGQIEQLTAQKQNLENQAALSSLTVTYGVEVVAVTQAAERWDPAKEVDHASATLVGLLQSVASAGIVFGIVWLPIIATLIVLAFVIRFVAMRMGIGRSSILPPPPPIAPSPPAAPGEN
jgi:hypothetical protein